LAIVGSTLFTAADARASKPTQLGFKPIGGSKDDIVKLPPGYTHDVLIRWGESLTSSVPDLDASRLRAGLLLQPNAAEKQCSQFGQTCNAIHFFPLSDRAHRGVLCVNNEYTAEALMFPSHPGLRGFNGGASRDHVKKHPQTVAVTKAAHGVSIVEV